MILFNKFSICSNFCFTETLLTMFKNVSLLKSSTVSLRKLSSRSVETESIVPPIYLESFKGITSSDESLLPQDVIICKDFVSDLEEQTLILEVEPLLKCLRYSTDHWDDAIHRYREMEKLEWNPENTQIIERIKQFAFPPGAATLKLVHVLDLMEDGFIKPHVDSVRFCGNTVAGLSLLSDSVMRFVSSKNSDLKVDVLLPRKSLYIMRNKMRYDFTHEILSNEQSYFNNEKIKKTRRISIICRNEPLVKDL